MADREPSRARESSTRTFRLTRGESLIRALVGSQAALLTLVCLGAPDGSGGGGRVDVPSLVAVLAVVYLVASVVGLLLGYAISRRRAVEIGPDGYRVGRKATAWADVPSVYVKRTRPGGQVVMAGTRRLPAPIDTPLRRNPSFERDAAMIRQQWEKGYAARFPARPIASQPTDLR